MREGKREGWREGEREEGKKEGGRALSQTQRSVSSIRTC